MPLYNFATYVDTREEWAVRADSLDEAKALVGDGADGDWLNSAVLLESDAVERRSDFVMDDDDEAPAIEEITPDHWAWRAVHRDYVEHSLRQNIAAISGDFHTHRLYDEFYKMFGELMDGFVGHYALCIAMAEALTNWELENGVGQAYDAAGVPWIEVVEDFVETVLKTATISGDVPDPAQLLSTIQVLTQGGAA